MNINLKKPRYVIPLLALPFLCLFFYVYSSSLKGQKVEQNVKGMNDNVADISEQVKNRELTNKLDAYRERYRESDGVSAIHNIEQENAPLGSNPNTGDQAGKKSLDSLARMLSVESIMPSKQSRSDRHVPSSGNSVSDQDRALEKALASLGGFNRKPQNAVPKMNDTPIHDPMEIFKKQMAYMDSVSSSKDPEYLAEKKEKESRRIAETIEKNVVSVSRAEINGGEFNTVLPPKTNNFIGAVIDENLTGYAGSRIRIKVAEDIYAGKFRLPKGTILYAEISGFSQQRIKLTISSIARDATIIPVHLEVYDLDGLPGLYIPASNFREFSKEIGTTSVQGFSGAGSAQNQQEFLMSAIEKIFTSTSSAVSALIRKNKARVKYNSQVYLIDAQSLQKPNH